MPGTSFVHGMPKHGVCEYEKTSYARVRVESRSKDGNLDRVQTA